MKDRKLNFLLLEDNPDDAELMVRELKNAKFVFEWKRVETEKAFREAIAEKPDIILADYTLPTYNGMAAIELQQELSPEIPIIIVTGSLGEERAVECLKSGATDYVLKENLDRLSYVVKRTLKEVDEYKQRRKAEEALRDSEEKFRRMSTSARDAVIMMDNKGNISFWNRSAEEMFGYSKQEILGKELHKIIVPEKYHEDYREGFRKFKTSGRGKAVSKLLELSTVGKDRTEFPIEISLSAVKIKGEWNAIGIVRDITERKRAETNLKERMKELQCLFNVTEICSRPVISLDELYKKVVNMLPQAWQYPEITGSCITFEDKIYKTDNFKKTKFLQRAVIHVKNKEVGTVEICYLRKKPDEYEGLFLKEKRELIDTIANLLGEYVERKQGEERIRFLSSSVEQSSDGIAIADINGKILFTNQMWAKMHGFKSPYELIGQNLKIFHNREQLEKDVIPFNKKVLEKGFNKGEVGHIRKDGSSFPTMMTTTIIKDEKGKHIAFSGMATDITRQKQLERQLFQSQKMEAIGTLAGGIAHEFNNLLVPILGFIEIVISDFPAESDSYKDLKQVQIAAERAKDLVTQILSFGKQVEGDQQPIQLTFVINEVLKLLRMTLPSTIKLQQDNAPNIKQVNANPTKMNQVLMNLCMNAYYAMPDGGLLEISLANVKLGKKSCEKFDGLKPGHFVRLTVKDSGCGMDKETLERIFDPFFTTKLNGEGTGMGLSVVHGIIKSYGGDITVHSQPSVGTTFHIYLPVARPVARPVEEASSKTTKQVLGGTESILFIDDEIVVAETGKRMLERLGYKVTTQTSSLEALELYRIDYGKFDLVIMDQTMPDMTGAELVPRFFDIRPDVPVILCTGYSSLLTQEKIDKLGISKFIMKPFIESELGRIVRQALDKSLIK